MTYFMYRIGDNAGDSGAMSTIYWRDDNNLLQYEDNARPRVGVWIKVGSLYARSYTAQDYWMTTPITEIVEDRDGYVRFKTRNSEYEWIVS